MSQETKTFTRIATVGLGVVLAAFGLVLYLKSIGIRTFGPVPTLALPLALFAVRAWLSAHFAPERIRRQQRMVAAMITLVCAAVVVSVIVAPA